MCACVSLCSIDPVCCCGCDVTFLRASFSRVYCSVVCCFCEGCVLVAALLCHAVSRCVGVRHTRATHVRTLAYAHVHLALSGSLVTICSVGIGTLNAHELAFAIETAARLRDPHLAWDLFIKLMYYWRPTYAHAPALPRMGESFLHKVGLSLSAEKLGDLTAEPPAHLLNRFESHGICEQAFVTIFRVCPQFPFALARIRLALAYALLGAHAPHVSQAQYAAALKAFSEVSDYWRMDHTHLIMKVSSTTFGTWSVSVRVGSYVCELVCVRTRVCELVYVSSCTWTCGRLCVYSAVCELVNSRSDQFFASSYEFVAVALVLCLCVCVDLCSNWA
jgi:hypothetical protein